MKTRKLLIVILAVVLIAVYYVLGTDYLKKRGDHEALVSEITSGKEALAQISPQPADLETKLLNAQTDLEEAKGFFPENLNSTQIIETILKLAADVGVKAIPLITQPWTTESIKGEEYSLLRLHISAKGSFHQVSDFLSHLENGEISTLVMEYVTVDSLTATFGREYENDDIVPVNTRLEIAVYSQPPAVEFEEEELSE